MFNIKNMANNNISESPSVNLIGAGTIIEGDVTTNGDIRIDGTLKGVITVKGKLVVGVSGSIDGETISGSVKGKITVSELLSLKASAKLTGDITTNKIAIEPGAVFSGSCSMGGVIKDIKGERTDKQKITEKTA